eukprot:scaffold32432_cov17-Tisochrysis_lutea.AAC.1
MSGTQEAPPPPPQGVSMVRTVQGRRQPSPGPREELPPQGIACNFVSLWLQVVVGAEFILSHWVIQAERAR